MVINFGQCSRCISIDLTALVKQEINLLNSISNIKWLNEFSKKCLDDVIANKYEVDTTHKWYKQYKCTKQMTRVVKDIEFDYLIVFIDEKIAIVINSVRKKEIEDIKGQFKFSI